MTIYVYNVNKRYEQCRQVMQWWSFHRNPRSHTEIPNSAYNTFSWLPLTNSMWVIKFVLKISTYKLYKKHSIKNDVVCLILFVQELSFIKTLLQFKNIFDELQFTSALERTIYSQLLCAYMYIQALVPELIILFICVEWFMNNWWLIDLSWF